MPSRRRAEAGTKVRAASLSHYLDVARAVGLDPLPLLRAAGIPKAWLAVPDHPVPSDAVVELLESSAQASGEEAFGLRMAESRQISDFGALGLLISHQRTLRDVLHTLMQYRNLLNEALALDVEPGPRVTVLREEVVTRTHQSARQANELAVAVLFLLCRGIARERWQPQAVHFTHAAPADARVHRRLFRCKLVFDSDFNGIACPSADLDAPNPLADPAMADYAERFVAALPGAQRGSLEQEVRRTVYLLLPLGRATIVQIAQSLGLNVRTLQRRLDEDGVRFGKIVNEVRRELAPRYLANPGYSLGRVSQQLGYTTPGSFTRWFSAQFGMAPGQWRAQPPKSKARGRAPAS